MRGRELFAVWILGIGVSLLTWLAVAVVIACAVKWVLL